MDRRFWRAAAVSAVLAAGTWLSAGEEFLLGSCAHFSKSRADVNATLDLMVEGGLSATRDDIVWAGWERERGKYTPQGYYESYLNRALELGLRPMQLINYGHKLYDPSGAMLYENPNPPQEAFDAFGRFAGWVAARYRGRGNAPQIYQIWNEWPGQAAPYAKALAAAYAQMKKADPDCIIVANSCHRREPFLEETFQQGVLQNCDGIAWHNYNHGELGEKNRSSETFFARVCNALELSKKYNNGVPKPMYLTEIGRPSHLGIDGSTEAEAADYLTQLLLLFRTEPAIKGAWIYNFSDSGYDPYNQEDNFGLCTADETPKEAFYAVRSIADVVRHAKFVRRWKTPDDVRLLQFRMPDGRDVLAAWTAVPDVRHQLIFSRGSAPDVPAELLVAGGVPTVRKWGWLEWVDADNNKQIGLGGRRKDEISFTAGSRPVLLFGKLDGVSLRTVKRIERLPKDGGNGGIKVPEEVILAGKSLDQAQDHPFGSELLYRRMGGFGPRNGVADLDASFRIAYDKENLLLEVSVTDDVPFNNFHGNMLWGGDSLQLAFSALTRNERGPAGTEYALALTPQGTEVFREASQIGLETPTQVKLDAKRSGTKTVYRITVPFAEIGVEPKPGIPIGMSLVVNDNDGKGRKGYLHWADGIANGKNPEQYNWIVLQ